jgi:leucyl aminopeptidase (aminopeptidase T)
MVPALRLDYGTIQRRVGRLKAWLDEAEGAALEFRVDGRTYQLELDLRHRHGHASSGCFPEPGSVGNLPSGEAYIVPYEGEFGHSSSRSHGELPVQFGHEVVIYTIAENRAVAVHGEGEAARREALAIAAEPAYANLAELGLGVLADLGVKPIGELLLDEKLGLHVAFGRSDHFGGVVGPAQFSSPAKAVHLDRVYLPETQPRVHVTRVDLVLEDGGGVIPLMRDGRYAVSLD